MRQRASTFHRPPLAHGVHLQWWLSRPSQASVARTETLAQVLDDTQALTGCVSSLSSPSTQVSAFNTTFSRGAAEFAQLLQRGGADQASVELPHATPQPFVAMSDIEASAEVIVASLARAPIDEDAIEAFGYMAWLTCVVRSA